jgi:hypothetical protein
MYRKESKWTPIVWCLLLIGFVAAGVWVASDAHKTEAKSGKVLNLGAGTSFPGTGTGAIPDDDLANPLVISFEVTGIGGAPAGVSVDMDVTHTWVGDIDATLAAPDGTTHDIIINTGGPGFGDSVTEPAIM